MFLAEFGRSVLVFEAAHHPVDLWGGQRKIEREQRDGSP